MKFAKKPRKIELTRWHDLCRFGRGQFSDISPETITKNRELSRMAKTKSNRTNLWRCLTVVGMSISLLTGIVITQGVRAQELKHHISPRKTSLLKYTTDLSAAADQGRFNDIEERTYETNRAIQILAAGNQNNPVVISESQATRDVVIVGVARRLATGDVPDQLAGKRLFKLNLNLLFHDASNGKELTDLLSSVLSDVANSDSKTILIIDPIQSLLGSAAAYNGAASSLLRDAISNKQIQCFGASTEAAFRQNVASQQSLDKLFATVEVEEVTSADARQDEAADSTKVKTGSEEF